MGKHVADQRCDPHQGDRQHNRLQDNQKRQTHRPQIDGGTIQRRQDRTVKPGGVQGEVAPAYDGHHAR